jgi:hypothetical protein
MKWFLAIAAVDTLFLFAIAVASARLWPHAGGRDNPVAMFAAFPFTFVALIVFGAAIGGPLHLLAVRYLPQRLLSFVGIGTVGGAVAVFFVPIPFEYFTPGLWAAGAATGGLSGLLWWKWVRTPDLREAENG